MVPVIFLFSIEGENLLFVQEMGHFVQMGSFLFMFPIFLLGSALFSVVMVLSEACLYLCVLQACIQRRIGCWMRSFPPFGSCSPSVWRGKMFPIFPERGTFWSRWELSSQKGELLAPSSPFSQSSLSSPCFPMHLPPFPSAPESRSTTAPSGILDP